MSTISGSFEDSLRSNEEVDSSGRSETLSSSSIEDEGAFSDEDDEDYMYGPYDDDDDGSDAFMDDDTHLDDEELEIDGGHLGMVKDAGGYDGLANVEEADKSNEWENDNDPDSINETVDEANTDEDEENEGQLLDPESERLSTRRLRLNLSGQVSLHSRTEAASFPRERDSEPCAERAIALRQPAHSTKKKGISYKAHHWCSITDQGTRLLQTFHAQQSFTEFNAASTTASLDEVALLMRLCDPLHLFPIVPENGLIQLEFDSSVIFNAANNGASSEKTRTFRRYSEGFTKAIWRFFHQNRKSLAVRQVLFAPRRLSSYCCTVVLVFDSTQSRSPDPAALPLGAVAKISARFDHILSGQLFKALRECGIERDRHHKHWLPASILLPLEACLAQFTANELVGRYGALMNGPYCARATSVRTHVFRMARSMAEITVLDEKYRVEVASELKKTGLQNDGISLDRLASGCYRSLLQHKQQDLQRVNMLTRWNEKDLLKKDFARPPEKVKLLVATFQDIQQTHATSSANTSMLMKLRWTRRSPMDSEPTVVIFDASSRNVHRLEVPNILESYLPSPAMSRRRSHGLNLSILQLSRSSSFGFPRSTIHTCPRSPALQTAQTSHSTSSTSLSSRSSTPSQSFGSHRDGPPSESDSLRSEDEGQITLCRQLASQPRKNLDQLQMPRSEETLVGAEATSHIPRDRIAVIDFKKSLRERLQNITTQQDDAIAFLAYTKVQANICLREHAADSLNNELKSVCQHLLLIMEQTEGVRRSESVKDRLLQVAEALECPEDLDWLRRESTEPLANGSVSRDAGSIESRSIDVSPVIGKRKRTAEEELSDNGRSVSPCRHDNSPTLHEGEADGRQDDMTDVPENWRAPKKRMIELADKLTSDTDELFPKFKAASASPFALPSTFPHVNDSGVCANVMKERGAKFESQQEVMVSLVPATSRALRSTHEAGDDHRHRRRPKTSYDSKQHISKSRHHFKPSGELHHLPQVQRLDISDVESVDGKSSIIVSDDERCVVANSSGGDKCVIIIISSDEE